MRRMVSVSAPIVPSQLMESDYPVGLWRWCIRGWAVRRFPRRGMCPECGAVGWGGRRLSRCGVGPGWAVWSFPVSRSSSGGVRARIPAPWYLPRA